MRTQPLSFNTDPYTTQIRELYQRMNVSTGRVYMGGTPVPPRQLTPVPLSELRDMAKREDPSRALEFVK